MYEADGFETGSLAAASSLHTKWLIRSRYWGGQGGRTVLVVEAQSSFLPGFLAR